MTVSAQSLESVVLQKSELDKMEKDFALILKSSTLSSDKKLAANLAVARELYQYRYYKKAEKYFNQAITIDSSSDKSEAFINQIAIALLLKNETLSQKYLADAKAYYAKFPQFYSEENKYYINSITSIKSNSPETTPAGYYGSFVVDAQIKELIKNKKYSDALLKFNAQEMQKSSDSALVLTYDLLTLVKTPSQKFIPLCKKAYDKKPNAYTYSAILCDLVIKKVNHKKIATADLERAHLYFKEDDTQYAYLFDFFKEIK